MRLAIDEHGTRAAVHDRIYAGTEGYLDKLKVSDVGRFEEELLRFMRDEHEDVLSTIRDEKEISGDTGEKLKAAVDSFTASFAA